ncbi:hypothetical protein L195_g014525 [Trifolium pratense]|uniref:Uncharacterized protein n=1 Tax=Trifolium pratense TaxID=57577 RepID=A0A2K3PR60_TRIPR|nr:hypothetical protein L195_g014525 [Trifolium pratense]
MDSLDQMMDDGTTYQAEPQKPAWCERKQAVVQEELRRMNQLPAKSTYVAHRLKRTESQEKELELLFAGLSL